MEYFKRLFTGGYEEMWKAIIRPPKDEYSDKELGPNRFSIKDKSYVRNDFLIYNKNNEKLHCSHWEPYDEEREIQRLPCVIYLHGNCSSRTESLTEVKHVLSLGYSFFSFDFSGCGRSDGEYVTLGHKEKEDVESVVIYLLKTNKVSKIGIWGRSMGSVTAMMFAEKFPKLVTCLVVDSPFSSLVLLIKELADEKSILPKFIINKIVSILRQTVKEKAGFYLEEINCLRILENLKLPIMFLSAKNDDFVKPHHSNFLYQEYKGKKQFIIFDGDHNTVRPKHIRDTIYKYLSIQLENNQIISNSGLYNLIWRNVLEEYELKQRKHKIKEYLLEKSNSNNNNNKLEKKITLNKNNQTSSAFQGNKNKDIFIAKPIHRNKESLDIVETMTNEFNSSSNLDQFNIFTDDEEYLFDINEDCSDSELKYYDYDDEEMNETINSFDNRKRNNTSASKSIGNKNIYSSNPFKIADVLKSADSDVNIIRNNTAKNVNINSRSKLKSIVDSSINHNFNIRNSLNTESIKSFSDLGNIKANSLTVRPLKDKPQISMMNFDTAEDIYNEVSLYESKINDSSVNVINNILDIKKKDMILNLKMKESGNKPVNPYNKHIKKESHTSSNYIINKEKVNLSLISDKENSSDTVSIGDDINLNLGNRNSKF